MLLLIESVSYDCVPILRTLPAKHAEKIADQIRKHNINALLIIGGFEVRFVVFVVFFKLYFLTLLLFLA